MLQWIPKSQKLPSDWDSGIVKTLTRENFDDVVENHKKYVLVCFCSLRDGASAYILTTCHRRPVWRQQGVLWRLILFMLINEWG